MRKFNARYKASVITPNEQTVIEYPITCKFNMRAGTLSQAANATIQFYNLAPSTRNKIFQDTYTFDSSNWKYITFEAGYENQPMSLIFKGRIIQAYSYKSSGSVDVITNIQAIPLNILGCYTSHTFEAGTTFQEAHNRIVSDMPDVTVGNVGSFEGTFLTPVTFEGNAFQELNKLTGGHSFVDNGILNTIMDNEVIDVAVPVISDSTVLLETPIRRDNNLEIKTLFEPNLLIGQLVEVQSNISPNFNGQFKLLDFTHDCLFSGTQAGNRITTLNLWLGPMLPKSNIFLTDEKTQSVFSKVKGNKIEPVLENTPSSVREVYQYLQKNNGAVPQTKITKNISWREMIGNDNTDAERKSELTLAKLTNVYNTALTFQKILNSFYPGKSIQINSGWRSVRNNTKCKGKPKSKHLEGLAIDFRIKGENQRSVYNNIRSIWTGWCGFYQNGSNPFVHVQINPTKGISNDR